MPIIFGFSFSHKEFQTSLFGSFSYSSVNISIALGFLHKSGQLSLSELESLIYIYLK